MSAAIELIYLQYRDPLIGVLDYIAEVSQSISVFEQIPQFYQQAPNQELAIAHEDDLKLIEGLVGGPHMWPWPRFGA